MEAQWKTTLTKFVDIAAFIAFVCLASSGMLMHFVLPPRSGRSAAVWGLTRHEWGEVHFWIAVTFFSVLVVHFFLHWRFVVYVIRGDATAGGSWRFLLGLLGLVLIVALALAPFVTG